MAGHTMKALEKALKAISGIFMQVTETGLALVAVIVVVYLLLGEDSGAFVISVVTNISLLISAVTAPAFVAAAIIIGLVYMIRTKK